MWACDRWHPSPYAFGCKLLGPSFAGSRAPCDGLASGSNSSIHLLRCHCVKLLVTGREQREAGLPAVTWPCPSLGSHGHPREQLVSLVQAEGVRRERSQGFLAPLLPLASGLVHDTQQSPVLGSVQILGEDQMSVHRQGLGTGQCSQILAPSRARFQVKVLSPSSLQRCPGARRWGRSRGHCLVKPGLHLP